MRKLIYVLVTALALMPALSASAQSGAVAPGQPPASDGLVETDPAALDPIGVDRDVDLSDVPGPPTPGARETAAEVALRGPRPPGASAQAGAVVTTISGIRETHHGVEVNLEDGLAEVTTRMTFASRARYPAEIAYRLAVPRGAALTSLEVCVNGRCRGGVDGGDGDGDGDGRRAYDDALRARSTSTGVPGVPGADGEARGAARPIAYAKVIDDDRGRAVHILAAAIPARGTLLLKVRYLAPAPMVGGMARVTLPARGSDPRAAPTTIAARAAELVGIEVDEAPADGPLVRDAWYSIAIAARLATGAPATTVVERFPCETTSRRGQGRRRCARTVITAGPDPGPPVDVVFAIDASPSTEGPARGRIASAVAALLSVAPPQSRVWVLSFGAEAATVFEGPRPPREVPLLPLAEAATRELGAATLFEEAWSLAERLLDGRTRPRPAHLIVVGDGGITRGPEGRAAFAAARDRGVTVSLVSVADRSPWAFFTDGVALTGGQVIEAGAAADAAPRGQGAARLEESVRALFARVVTRRVTLGAGRRRIPLGALRAGEQLVFVGPVGGRAELRVEGGGRVTRRRATSPRAAGLVALAGDRGRSLVAIDPADLASDVGAADVACIDVRGPAQRPSGISSDEAPVALAEARRCSPTELQETARAATSAPRDRGGDQATVDEAGGDIDAARRSLAGSGIPAETVLRMLRRRVQPVARRCFRRDRAGRLDYSVRAEFVVRLEDRELTEARVDGEITDELRSCLLSAAHDLDVPRFRGAVLVRYPLYTERAPRPPTVELIPEVARQVDAVGIDGRGN